MRIKEKLIHFWNVTLGPDLQPEIDIENSKDPNMTELRESLTRNVTAIEAKFIASNRNSSPKGGKDGLVEKAEVDTAKAMKEASQKVVSGRETEQLEK